MGGVQRSGKITHIAVCSQCKEEGRVPTIVLFAALEKLLCCVLVKNLFLRIFSQIVHYAAIISPSVFFWLSQ